MSSTLSKFDNAIFGSTPVTMGLLAGLMLGVHFALGFEVAVIILLVLIALGVWHP